MGASVSDEAIKRHKELSIRRIDGLLDSYIVTGDTKHMKKADLISYWLEEFSKYISQEESFDPGRLIRYSRGDVIRVNFGFRVGSEFGGLHFAVVVEKGNARSSKVVTVVPLSSTDGRTIRPENVDLGQELYTKAIAQQNVLLLKAQKRIR
ncbi:MAG: type II toxin-antitoxin system PemK/MazF family toxin [Lachnospiraceae bacterium]|nr:type II toxin-antitoxin system PemK/MazF family toxin [Lachnospiraceae bacterium]